MDPVAVRGCLLGVLGLLYVLISLRVAWRVGQSPGRRALWFVVTVALTAIPASLVLLHRQRAEAAKRRRESTSEKRLRRCMHCGGLLPEEAPAAMDVEGAGAGQTCPHCGMKLDSTHIA